MITPGSKTIESAVTVEGLGEEAFSGVEIHMEVNMEWKLGTICENVIDWFGFGEGYQLKTIR